MRFGGSDTGWKILERNGFEFPAKTIFLQKNKDLSISGRAIESISFQGRSHVSESEGAY